MICIIRIRIPCRDDVAGLEEADKCCVDIAEIKNEQIRAIVAGGTEGIRDVTVISYIVNDDEQSEDTWAACSR